MGLVIYCKNPHFREKTMTKTVESLIQDIINLLKQGQTVEALKVAEKAVGDSSKYPRN
jgi:hypothetical protein